MQAYWSCQLGEPVLDIFIAKFSRALGPGCVDIVVVGERTLFTLREQGTVRLQKILGYQPSCACKYVVVAAPGEEGARLTGTMVREIDPGFAAVVEEENIIIAADTDQLMVYKVREKQTGGGDVACRCCFSSSWPTQARCGERDYVVTTIACAKYRTNVEHGSYHGLASGRFSPSKAAEQTLTRHLGVHTHQRHPTRLSTMHNASGVLECCAARRTCN